MSKSVTGNLSYTRNENEQKTHNVTTELQKKGNP